MYLVWWPGQAKNESPVPGWDVRIFLSPKMSRLSMEPTHSSVQWYMGLFSKR